MINPSVPIYPMPFRPAILLATLSSIIPSLPSASAEHAKITRKFDRGYSPMPLT